MPHTAISTSYGTDHYHASFEENEWPAGQSLARVLANAGYDVKISLRKGDSALVIEWPVAKNRGEA